MTFLLAFIAYLIGSIPFGYLIVKLKEGRDVRSSGSGNMGATNVLRTAGRSSAVLTLFPSGTPSFDFYAFGLAIGFFFYLLLSMLIAIPYGSAEGSATKGAKAARVFLGDD